MRATWAAFIPFSYLYLFQSVDGLLLNLVSIQEEGMKGAIEIHRKVLYFIPSVSSFDKMSERRESVEIAISQTSTTVQLEEPRGFCKGRLGMS